MIPKEITRIRKSKKKDNTWPKDTKEIARIRKSKKTDNTMAKRYQRDSQHP